MIAIIFQLILGGYLMAQDEESIAQTRKDNLIKVLNYRFKGGYYTFEKMFVKNVTYPEMAKLNCIVGISIISLNIDCEGNISGVRIKTPLGYGIDGEITNFIHATEGHWNNCNDDKYTKFEIPIQFLLEGTKTNETDALLVMIDENPGFLCNGDEYYIKKLEKYMDKEKYKKALPYIDIMIRRDPYNSHYFDLKRKAINGGD